MWWYALVIKYEAPATAEWEEHSYFELWSRTGRRLTGPLVHNRQMESTASPSRPVWSPRMASQVGVWFGVRFSGVVLLWCCCVPTSGCKTQLSSWRSVIRPQLPLAQSAQHRTEGESLNNFERSTMTTTKLKKLTKGHKKEKWLGLTHRYS